MRRARDVSFLLGCALIGIGVLLHLPMFWRDIAGGMRLMAMPFDFGMVAGMAMILGGTVIAGAALWKRVRLSELRIRVDPAQRLNRLHWALITALVAVLIVDTVKPATLGFVVPGMAIDYRLPRSTVAWLPFAALTGTTVGSVLWGWFADHQGRKSAILLSTLLFIGTAICGAMPSFGWNIAMCFLMGASAGGLLPVAYALLTEMLPTRNRGMFLVLVGGLGSAGGFFVASGMAAGFEPIFGWRVLWLVGLPTGLIVLALSLFLPESPLYLARVGRLDEARAIVASYGGALSEIDPASSDQNEPEPLARGFGRATVMLLVSAGLIWGLTNFGFLLWLPTMLRAEGVAVGASSQLLAGSSLVAFLTIFPATLLYHRLHGATALLIALIVTAIGLAMIALSGAALPGVLTLLVGVNAVIAMLLPYAAECTPAGTRGRSIGIVAAGSKAGGLGAQALTLAGLTPSIGAATVGILLPLLVLIGIMIFNRVRALRA